MGRRKTKNGSGTMAPRADEDPTDQVRILAPGPAPAAEASSATVIDPNVLALRRVDAEIRRLMESWVELEQQLAARDQEIAGLREHADLAERDLRTAYEEVTAIRGESERLRAELAAAQGAGRDRQAQAERELAEHRDALLGMAAELRRLEKAGHSHEEQKALLAARTEEVERRCAELNGTLEQRAAAIASLEDQAREARDTLALERAAGDEWRARLEAREQALQQLGVTLDRQREKTETALNDAARAGQLLAERQARVAELEGENARLAAQVAEQAGKLAAVDSEYREKCRAIAALGMEVDRLAAIQANLRDLDSRIVRRLGASPAPAPASEPDGLRNTRLLVSMDGAGAARYPLYKEAMVIGRGADADIRVRGRHTSRRHARILVDAAEVTIEDLGSLNGVTVNDRAVSRQPLLNGDVVDVGGARLRYLDLREKPGEAQAGG